MAIRVRRPTPVRRRLVNRTRWTDTAYDPVRMGRQQLVVLLRLTEGPVDSMELRLSYRISNPSARIGELVKRGVEVDREWITRRDESGTVCKFVRYKLKEHGNA